MQWIALFRGINVGGKHIVKMAELKQLFLEIGFTDVQSYIQSGNVIFRADGDEISLREWISAAFDARFGFHSDVILRSGEELAAAADALPFSKADITKAEAASPDVEHLYLYFSNDPADPVLAADLQAAYGDPGQLIAGKREYYLLCHESVRNAKLAQALARRVPALTARNQKTVRKLLAMLEEVSKQREGNQP